VVVLDTGLAAEGVRPASLAWLEADRQDWELPDEDDRGHLDPAGGHGTYIAGLIEQLAPGCEIVPERVLSTMGDGDEATVAAHIEAIGRATGKSVDQREPVDLLNLSFGGYGLERPHVLESAIRRVQAAGTVVVASAGNDATCQPTFPAALPGVIAVGALGPGGPAPFTNYGRWVRACAPGVDVVAPFFTDFNGAKDAPVGEGDPDDFHGWARWSGTSFAAPVVVAALAREMRRSGVDAKGAVARVIDAPGLLRIPDLGTVVNLQ
jgi:subtilisin family serine protease